LMIVSAMSRQAPISWMAVMASAPDILGYRCVNKLGTLGRYGRVIFEAEGILARQAGRQASKPLIR